MKRPSNALALAVLTLLFEQPMHPYQMSSDPAAPHKEESIRLNYGSLYSVVDSLAKKGLIAAGEAHREGNRPERTVYELTDDGELAMREWLAEMLRDPSPQYTDFEAALSLAGALPPSEVLALLRHRITVTEDRLRNQYEGALAVLPEGFPELFMDRGRLRRRAAPGRDDVRRATRREASRTTPSTALTCGAASTSSATPATPARRPATTSPEGVRRRHGVGRVGEQRSPAECASTGDRHRVAGDPGPELSVASDSRPGVP